MASTIGILPPMPSCMSENDAAADRFDLLPLRLLLGAYAAVLDPRCGSSGRGCRFSNSGHSSTRPLDRVLRRL